MNKVGRLKSQLTDGQIKASESLADVYIGVDYYRVDPDKKDELKMLAAKNPKIHHLAVELNKRRFRRR